MKQQLLIIVSLGLIIIQCASGQEKHVLQDDMLPTVKEFFKMSLGDAPRSSVKNLPSDEIMAEEMLKLLIKSGKYTPDKIAKLRANKAIRDPKEFTKMIDSWPDTDGVKDMKGRFSNWFADKKHSERRRELMYFLMHFLIPPK